MTNEQNHRTNKTVIANGFKRAREEHFELVTKNMIRVFSDLVTKEYIRLHNEKDIGRHLFVSDSWGWSLFYDGALIDMWTNGGGKIEGIGGEGDISIEKVLSEPASKKGWSGMFAASLEPVKYYRYDHENDIFNEIIPDVGVEMAGMFTPKPIRR